MKWWPWRRKRRTVLRLKMPAAGVLRLEEVPEGFTRPLRLPRCNLQVQAGDVVEVTVAAHE